MASALSEPQAKLYRLIWQRYVACQMTPAQWDSTSILLERSDALTGAVFKAAGRVLVFDGFYRASSVPTHADEQTLPELAQGHQLAPFDLQPEQLFTSPPPRYSEASLVKELEADGIGRPSTYAQIIQVIQDRRYVEQVDRKFYATDLGEVVTDKLVDGFPRLMDVKYTSRLEEDLDKIEEQHIDWRQMLGEFYERFSAALETAHRTMSHAKAETQPAPYQCPRCGSRTQYRFGKNGRFLSCASYPGCDYAAPINREGRPMLPEHVDMVCPIDGSDMILRTGRFGRFLASTNYPQVEFVINLDKQGRIKYPATPPVVTELACEKCSAPLNLRRGKRGPWLGCSRFPRCRGRMAWSKVDEAAQKALLARLEEHEKQHPQIVLRRRDGSVIPEGTPVQDLVVPGGVDKLDIHPEAKSSEAA
jgi:DNA topoisomerase-1